MEEEVQNKIKQLRKDSCQLESSKDKEVSHVRHWETLERKYKSINIGCCY